MPARRPIFTPTLLMMLCGIAGFLAIGLWGEYATFRAHYQKNEAHLLQAAQAIGQHVDDSVEMAELAIAAMEAEIKEEGDREGSIAELRNVMRQQQQWAERLEGLLYVNKDGGIIVSSVSAKTASINVSDRDYFIHHKNSVSLGTYIGPPLRNRINGNWAITVSRRLNGSDGSFQGILMANIRLSHLLDFFNRFDVGSNGSILLSRGDGMVLARLPMRENVLGNVMKADDPFFTMIRDPDQRNKRFVSAVDGTVRNAASYISPKTNLIVAASCSEWENLAEWVNGAKLRWMFGALMIALAAILSLRWRTQARLRAQSEAMLRQREEEFALLAESSADLIEKLSVDGTREYVSSASYRILGREPSELVGTNIFEEIICSEIDQAAETWRKLRNGDAVSRVQFPFERPDGTRSWLETSMSPLKNAQGSISGVVAITRDVSRQKAMQDELDILANTDALTGLANRRAFDIRLDALLREAEEETKPLSLLMIDADCFKQFNDSYGHSAGDECLKSIASAISDAVRPGDMTARYGGEEIAILLPDTGEASATLVAEKIRRRIEKLDIRHEANRPWGRVTVSIGVASLESQAAESSLLFAKADSALYEAKKRGRNRVFLGSTLSHGAGLASAG